jgi:hypothetical protein
MAAASIALPPDRPIDPDSLIELKGCIEFIRRPPFVRVNVSPASRSASKSRGITLSIPNYVVDRRLRCRSPIQFVHQDSDDEQYISEKRNGIVI